MCGTVQVNIFPWTVCHLRQAGFEFFLLLKRVHARPAFRNWALGWNEWEIQCKLPHI